MKFKTDETLPIEVRELLRHYGHDALSVIDQQLAGHPDLDGAQVCQPEKRALVTLDLDFADMRAYPPSLYSGLVVLRPGMQTIPMILRLVEEMIQLLTSQPIDGHLWIVEERHVRIRAPFNINPAVDGSAIALNPHPPR